MIARKVQEAIEKCGIDGIYMFLRGSPKYLLCHYEVFFDCLKICCPRLHDLLTTITVYWTIGEFLWPTNCSILAMRQSVINYNEISRLFIMEH